MNYSDEMWVGTNSNSLADEMKPLVGSGDRYWVGGEVVPDAELPHGFCFNPNTVLYAEVTVEGMQTTIRQIAEDPDYFANNGWPNGLANHAWYVSGLFQAYRSGNP